MNYTKGSRRWIPVIVSVFIQLCLGSTYIWSVFQSGIASALFNGNNGLAGLSFSLMIAMLSIGGIIAGALYKKNIKPKIIVFAGGIILGLGFILASLTSASAPWLLWFTFGILGGIGMGMAYSITISVSQRWFPDKRGLITGIIISALGLGGVVFTPVAETLMNLLNNGAIGSGELRTFLVLGIFLIICTVGGLFIVEPPQNFSPKGKIQKQSQQTKISFTPKQMLGSYQYYALTIAFLFAALSGLMMIGFAKPIAVAKGMAQAAYIGVIVISMFNALGRLFWGWISDKWGRKNTLIVILIANIAFTLLVDLAQGYVIFVIIALIGFVYGGILTNFASITADYYGPMYMTLNYGLIMLGFGAGGVISSFVAGYFKDIAANDISLMFPAFIISAAASAVAVILIALVKPPIIKNCDKNKN